MATGAVIAAAGSSRRMGFDKLAADLGGSPVLAHTIAAIAACPDVDEIVLVVSSGILEWARALALDHGAGKAKDVCLGGAQRYESVLAGLDRLPECQWVLIHDGARPFVDREIVARGLAAAAQAGAAIAAVAVKDTIKVVNEHGVIVETPERAHLWAAQTPQVFRRDLILAAYQQLGSKLEIEVTDDAQILERAGTPVRVFQGSYENIKITTPEDLVVARAILEAKRGRAAR